MKLVCFFVLLLLGNMGDAKNAPHNVWPLETSPKQINRLERYVQYVDSLEILVNNGGGPKGLIRSIAEGPITITKVSVVKNQSHSDTIKKVENYGWSKNTIENHKGDTVYKISYHDNVDKNFYEHYYFKDNRLIFARVELQEYGAVGNVFYFKEEYYDKNGSLLFKKESPLKIAETYRKRVSFTFWDKGNTYLKEFKEHK